LDITKFKNYPFIYDSKRGGSMLDNCNYNKIRLLHDLSKIVWYLEKHAKQDAEESGHKLCSAVYDELQKDLEKHAEKLRQAIEGLSKEGKFA
jgi:mevalonate pyrophosphate decarboxylase